MEFKNYMLVAMGGNDTIKGIMTDIRKIAIDDCQIVMNKPCVMMSFRTTFMINEIKDFINQVENRTFFISEMNSETFAMYLPDVELHQHLLKNVTSFPYTHEEPFLDEETDVECLSKEERMELLDSLIDKGLDNLTNKEKNLLDLLSKEV